uniref:Cholinergic receptor, nicotinic, alpha 9 n=1 Tax=Hucho hucho TaxID=62062 RepID=A0A4W5KTX5_9TELE
MYTVSVYTSFQVDIAMGMDSGDLSDFVENVEWECHGMPAVRNVIMYGCCSDPYPDITYTLHLKRRSLFYIFNLLLPCFLISFLAPLGFYLPADSGEKVSLGVTVLLALTVFQLMVAESMPPSESVPYIGDSMMPPSESVPYIGDSMMPPSESAKPVLHWAKVLIIDYMSKILFVYEVGENCTTPESERTPLYSEEPMSGNSALARNHYHDDLYHDSCYQDDYRHLNPYQYGNGHLQNHHSTHQNHLDNSRYANGGHHDNHYSNHSNQKHHSNPSQTSKGEGGEEKREPPRRYHHIGREELDYQAPPPGNLQNGGLNEPLPYPKEKHLSPASAPACACSCPHHKQVVYNIQYIANCFSSLPPSLSSPSLSSRWCITSSTLPTVSHLSLPLLPIPLF